jgi:ABC-type antimicrobial peptide transport system permease subunit
LFAWEAVFVALLGWLATIAIAPPLSRAISASFGTLVIQYPFDYRAADGSNTAALGVALAIALLASALPIRSALKMTAHRALRAE